MSAIRRTLKLDANLQTEFQAMGIVIERKTVAVSGAEIENYCREASMETVRELIRLESMEALAVADAV